MLNSLKRYTLSAVLVPRQNLALVYVPPAPAAGNPGMSTPIPLQGPGDGDVELYSLIAGYKFTNTDSITRNAGIGTVSYAANQLTGVGTQFITQLAPGATIYVLTDGGVLKTVTVLSIQSNTLLTLTGAIVGALTNQPFAYEFNAGAFTDSVYVTLTDQAWRRKLMNRDVPAFHVFGTQRKPLFMKESLLLKTDQSIIMNFYNYSTDSGSYIAPSGEGRKWQKEATKYPKVNKFIDDLWLRKKWVQPYWLTLDDGYLDIPYGTSKGAFLTCTGDITLVLFNAYASAIGSVEDAQVDESNNVYVELSDAKTTRSLQVQPTPLSNMSGTSQNPFRFPTPWIVEPQTQIRAFFTNNAASSEQVRVTMTFHGVAIYTGSNFTGSTLTNKHLTEEAHRMYEAMSVPQIRAASPQI